jgi:hypothetical protein
VIRGRKVVRNLGGVAGIVREGGRGKNGIAIGAVGTSSCAATTCGTTEKIGRKEMAEG